MTLGKNSHALVVDDDNPYIKHFEYNEKATLKRCINNHVPEMIDFDSETESDIYVYYPIRRLYFLKNFCTEDEMQRILNRKKFSGIVPENLISFCLGNNEEYNRAAQQKKV